MSYEDVLLQEQRQAIDVAISVFINWYRIGRPTIILLPGGMGSKLNCSMQPYPAPNLTYDTAWLDYDILCGDGRRLEMDGDRDIGNHIVVAAGPTEFHIDPLGIVQVAPYDKFELWCAYQAYNCFIFGWDWRRPLGDSVELLRSYALPNLSARVFQVYGEDPLADNSTIVGHSFGGLVLKLLLDAGGPQVAKFARAVSVATPFYGYGGQMHRFYKGDPMLNDYYSPAEIARITSSFKALYALLFTDRLSFQQHPPVGLANYPVRDAVTNADADPYAPGAHRNDPARFVRYPEFNPFAWFDTAALQAGLAVRRRLVTPIADLPTRNKFYHFVGVIHDQQGNEVASTVETQVWDWIDKTTFDPATSLSPVVDELGPGDDTIPKWSARLPSTPAANVTILDEIQDHAFIMEHAQTLQALQNLIRPDEMLSGEEWRQLLGTPPATADSETTRQFLKQVAPLARGKVPPEIVLPDGRRIVAKSADEYIRLIPPRVIVPLVRRFLRDIFTGKAPPDWQPAQDQKR